MKTRTLVFFTRLATDNVTENLCIEATWEAKGHFLFLLGKKRTIALWVEGRGVNGLMDCSIISPGYNQLHWLIMVRQLETKIILVKTRDICCLYYKTQATGRAQRQSYPIQESATWFSYLYFQMFFYFSAGKRAKWEFCFHVREGYMLSPDD